MPVFYNETDEKTEASKVRIHHWKPLLGLTFFYFFIACGIERIYQPMVIFFNECKLFKYIIRLWRAGILPTQPFCQKGPTYYVCSCQSCAIVWMPNLKSKYLFLGLHLWYLWTTWIDPICSRNHWPMLQRGVHDGSTFRNFCVQNHQTPHHDRY